MQHHPTGGWPNLAADPAAQAADSAANGFADDPSKQKIAAAAAAACAAADPGRTDEGRVASLESGMLGRSGHSVTGQAAHFAHDLLGETPLCSSFHHKHMSSVGLTWTSVTHPHELDFKGIQATSDDLSALANF